MTQAPELLPDELVFESDGHLGEVVLTAIADGEFGLVPGPAMDHLGTCDACTRKLGALAMMAEEVGRAVVHVAAAPKKVAKVHTLPFPALAAAAFLAVAGSLPKLLGLPAVVTHAFGFGMRSVPIVTRVGNSVMKHGTAGPYALTLIATSTLVLVMAGILVARTRPRTRLA
ncbi:MAG: hypothetical protein U0169_17485 [Polyangiaceae bacterium]